MTKRFEVLLAVALVCAAACKKNKDDSRLSWNRDASVIVVDRPTFGGDTIFEVEPNEDVKTTQVLPIPGQIGGVLTAPTDIDVFKLEVKSDGLLKLTLECNDDVDLSLELLDAAGKTQVKSDRGPAKTSEGVANLPVVAGTTYFVRVTEFRKKGAPARIANATYRLTAELSGPAPEDQEKEPNNDATVATPLVLGARGFGYLGWAKDVDVWQLSAVPADAGMVLDVIIEGVEGLPLKATVSAGEEFSLSRTGAAGQTLLIPAIAVIPGAVYTIAIESKRSDPSVPYVLRVDSRPGGALEEREPNDDPVRAIPLAPAGVPSGTRSGSYGFGDRDVYRLDVTSDARLDVDVRPGPKSNPALEVRVGEDAIPADGGKFGAPEQVSVPVTAGSTVYVIVSGTVRADDTGYQLSFALSDTNAASPLTQ